MPLTTEEKFKALCEFVRTLPKDGNKKISGNIFWEKSNS